MKIRERKVWMWLLVSALAVSLIPSAICQAQGGKGNKMVELKEWADSYFESKDYLRALDLYKQMGQSDTAGTWLNYRIGVCMFQLKDQRAGAKAYFEKAIIGMPVGMYTPMEAIRPEVLESYYYLGRFYHWQKEFDKAVKMFQVYQNYKGLYSKSGAGEIKREVPGYEIDNYISKALYAKDALSRIQTLKAVNMDAGINSSYPDYAPIIAADGSKLIFTSRRAGTGGLADPRGEYFEDIYVSQRNGVQWDEPVSISTNINTDLHDAGIGLSVNGEQLMLFRTNPELTGGDIYTSEYLEGWSTPVLLTSTHYVDEHADEGINTRYIEPSACLSRDGDVLFFSSNRPGGYGGLDLYRVVKLSDGQWSLAVNLGPTVNTPFDEDAPFIHPDNKTLFFSSKGHKNMGGYDVFKTVLAEQGEELQSNLSLLWSIPENLLPPVNSVADDIYYMLTPGGETAYFSSDREGGLGGADIYTVQQEVHEGLLIVVKGTVISLDDMKPLQARLTVLDQSSHSLVGEYNTNPRTGKFVMILSPKQKYRMMAEAEGHYSFSEQYFLVSYIDTFTILNKEIYMEPVKIEVEPTAEYLYSYVLENVHFESKKYELLPGFESAFTTLIRAMIANPKMRIEIAGHTDDSGGQAENLELSQKRADAVKAYLMSKGISELRLISKGYGESTPVAGNDTEEGRAMNRRTEIRVLDE